MSYVTLRLFRAVIVAVENEYELRNLIVCL